MRRQLVEAAREDESRRQIANWPDADRWWSVEEAVCASGAPAERAGKRRSSRQ